MELLRLLVEHDPASPEFRNGVRAAFEAPVLPGDAEFDLRGVFVNRPLPWGRFLESAVLHAAAVVLIMTASVSWIRQQKLLDKTAFDRQALVTYTPDEYLPPLDTGAPEAPEPQTGEPEYAKQPILSVPPEADNRSQTIVAPPDIKLDHDVALPNIVATSSIAPAVPMDATRTSLKRMNAPDTQVVAPAPEVEVAQNRIVQASMKSDVIAPPPEVTQSNKGHVGLMNIGPSDVVAPAPQLTLDEQHTASRGKSRLGGGSVQPVGPPPSDAEAGNSSGGGRLVALGIHPVAPTGPVPVPAGNRRGTFAAGPQGKHGAAGTPDVAGTGHGDGSSSSKTHNGASSMPSGLHVGAGDSNGREVASLSSPAKPEARAATVVPSEKVTDLDRQVFGDKTFHTMALNMPNLNSSTGSWVIHFAELEDGRKEGALIPPRSTEKSDPGYPLELIRANVHGMVSLYAVIDANGKVSGVRVINSPDDRLDAYAAKALAQCKFQPAERAGKAVALEALVMIPFRVKRDF
jgi:TonB family protein